MGTSSVFVLDDSSRDGVGEEDDDDDDLPLRKALPKKQTKTKKTPGRKKLTATTIASSATLSPPLNNFNDGSNDSIPESLVKPTPVEPPKKRKYTKRGDKAASVQVSLPSPSPPSSDTEEESSDDEEKSKISRIRELAAKATKQLKRIEKQSVKTKVKGSRVVKMEVQTVSQKVTIEHPQNAAESLPAASPNTKLETKPPAAVEVVPVAVETKSVEEVLPLSPQSPTPTEQEQPPQLEQGDGGGLSPRAPSSRLLKQMEKSANITRPTRVKTKVSRIDKVILEDDDDDDNDDDDEVLSPQTPPPPSIPPTSPPSNIKASFKIPKRTHGENGQVSAIYLGVVSFYATLFLSLIHI